MEQAPHTDHGEHGEEAAWVMDPSGHYHMRPSGSETGAYSLVRKKRNGNDIKREKKASMRQGYF